MQNPNTAWHQLETSQALAALESDLEQGLSSAAVTARQAEYGPNELVDRGVKSPWRILWEQLTGIMVVILLVAALVSVLLGEYTDAIVVLVIVVLNAVLGFSQEYRAEQAMAALKKMAAPRVRVRRDGHLRELPAGELVPGDVVLLEAGSLVPADARLVESANLRVQEAVLTGESEPVEKYTHSVSGENLPVADRRNMLYLGTVATYGRGAAVVTATGMRTELGRIAEMIQSVQGEQTPLQRRLEQLGRGLAVAALFIVGLVFLFGLLRGEDLRVLILTAISMAVAAVPEGLPAVVTIALALGAQRMLKRNALIRKLPAVETLGSVTVICSDKTGTLTENRMTVTVLDVAENRMDLVTRLRFYSPVTLENVDLGPEMGQNLAFPLLLVGGALCNDAYMERSEREEQEWTSIGDPTEGALVITAARHGLWKDELEKILPRQAEIPFDSDRKRMTTVHQVNPEHLPPFLEPLNRQQHATPYIAFTKGAVDGMLERSSAVWVDDQIQPMDAAWRGRVQAANEKMAGSGVRVLGLALHWLPELPETAGPELEQDMVFVGLFGMIDPARPEVAEAVAVAKTAGIRPIMITGDHPLTALYIAKELGFDHSGGVIIGRDLVGMADAELERRLETVSVFARVSPEHKLNIVNALQRRGQIVAMTGDGVNDAPALKTADIGVAMGITGTDVSKEASDMILLDDNFATIVAAVEEGRRIYDNIRKFIKYTMTSNAGEIWVMLLAPFLGMPLPLLPLQILWVNLVTDGLPGLALSLEPAERGVMRRKPFPPGENIFARGMARDILWIGLLMGLVSLAVGWWAYGRQMPAWQTMVFTTLTLAQMGNALVTRSDSNTLLQIGIFSNPAMLGSVLLTLVLQMLVIYVPFLQGVFDTVALTPGELGVSLAASLPVMLAVDAVKLLRQRLNRV